MYRPDVQSRIADLQLKQLAGTLTIEDVKESVALLREGRMGAQAASARKRAKKKPIDTDKLFAELKKL